MIPENLKEIGFSRSHVIQVARDGYLTSEDFQGSLDAFSYDLAQGKVKASFGPLRLLMGVLRKQKMPYVSEALLEQEKLALEQYQAKRKRLEESQKEIAASALTLKFQEWWNGMTQSERNEYVPPTQFVGEGSEVQQRIALGIFLKEQGDA